MIGANRRMSVYVAGIGPGRTVAVHMQYATPVRFVPMELRIETPQGLVVEGFYVGGRNCLPYPMPAMAFWPMAQMPVRLQCPAVEGGHRATLVVRSENPYPSELSAVVLGDTPDLPGFRATPRTMFEMEVLR